MSNTFKENQKDQNKYILKVQLGKQESFIESYVQKEG